MSFVVSPSTYEVQTRFRVNRRIPGLREAQGQIRSLNSSINQFTRSFAVLAAGYGVARLAKGVAGLNSEIQNAEISIGAVFNALTATPLTKSIAIARRELRGLRQDAARLPGELSDYIRTYQQISGAVLNAGGRTSDIRTLTTLGIVGGSAVNPQTGMRNIGFDIMQALSVGANQRTTRDLNIALQGIGQTTESFNKLSKPERLRVLISAFGKFGEAAEVMGRTFDAQTATLRDNVYETTRILSRPLFNRITEELIQVNEWIDRNRTGIEKWARVVSGRLVGAYEKVRDAITSGKVGRGLVTGAGVAAGGYAAARAAPLVTGIHSAIGSLGVLGGAGVAAGGASLTAATGGIILAIGLITATFVNAAGKWPDVSGSLISSLGRLGGALVNLVVQVSSIITRNPLMLQLGRMMMRTSDLFVQSITLIINTIALGASKLAQWTNLIDMPQMAIKDFDAFAEAWQSGLDKANRYLFGGKGNRRDMEPPQDDPGNLNRRGDTIFNGPVTVTIKPERIDNPNLLARDMESVFDYLSEFREGSSSTTLVPRGT